MTDRPIIFSAAMIRALLAGRKTQTRRLASSPLRRCEVGDRLYVREAFSVRGIYSDVVEVGYSASERQSRTEYIEQIPVALADGAKVTWPKARPSIHMPRWASRLTLIVEGVKVEPLQAISRSDAIAEGLRLSSANIEEFWRWPEPYHAGHWLSPPAAYRWLWDQLHGEGASYANPDVVALTFRVERANIDRPPP